MKDSSFPRLEVCLSPALLHLFDTENTVVVIIDIFRASSTITAALHNGAKCVIPVAYVDECMRLGISIPNSITAGERDGKIIAGLQAGNSPIEFSSEKIKDKTLILTTTNGTRLLHMVKNADSIIIGSFLNLDTICSHLIVKNKNVLLGCASWKDRFNLEDTLFAGAVVDKIKDHFHINCDSARAANYLYRSSLGIDILKFLENSTHFHRLTAFGLQKDLAYCTTLNIHPVLPVLNGEEIVRG